MGILNTINNKELLFNYAQSGIEEVYFMNDLPWVIGYSGGKDSTCTTQIIVDTLIKLKKEGKKLQKHIYIISSDTLVETPMIVGTIKKTIDGINRLAEKEKLPISGHIIKPSFDNTFWTNLIGKGYPCPNQTFRWCTDRMKINPANDFIMSIVDQFGEAIMVLGVRDGESESRDRVLEKHTIEGKKLMRHTTMSNAYVFAPIRAFSIDDVWAYLLGHDSPWGSNNRELFELYKESAEDCPLIIDKETKQNHTCGNSRFGCWVCTVVSKDKSLTSFINKGEKWLMPLLDFRNWLYSIRDDEDKRMRRRQDGSIYFARVSFEDGHVIIPKKGNREKIIISNSGDKWIDNSNNEWLLFDGPMSEANAKDYIFKNKIQLDDGTNPRILIKRINDEYAQLGPGPFTLDTRKLILKKLFELQRTVGEKHKLFQEKEIYEIRKLWREYGFTDEFIPKTYNDVFGEELESFETDDVGFFDEDDYGIIKKLCDENGMPFELLKEILSNEMNYMGYSSRSEIGKSIRRILSKEYARSSLGQIDGEQDED